MSEQPITKDLKDTIEDLDKNVQLLEDAEEINLTDCKTLLTQLFEILKDALQRFEPIFEMVEKIQNIEKATEKGEKYMEKNGKNSDDIRRLYM